MIAIGPSFADHDLNVVAQVKPQLCSSPLLPSLTALLHCCATQRGRAHVALVNEFLFTADVVVESRRRSIPVDRQHLLAMCRCSPSD